MGDHRRVHSLQQPKGANDARTRNGNSSIQEFIIFTIEVSFFTLKLMLSSSFFLGLCWRKIVIYY
jgi:hypothetical protein